VDAAQGSFWRDDREFARALHSGHLALIYAAAGRRVLEAIDGPEDAYYAAIDLLAAVLPEVPPEGYDPTPFIEAQMWVEARTMPEHPHSYVLLRRSTDWREHLRFLTWIRAGDTERWVDGRTYRFRDVGDYHYWALSAADSILNRRRLS
jgi:hypothetical protein